MTHPTDLDELEVTQADRDAAEEFIHGPHFALQVRRGEADDAPIVQAFARHRLVSARREQALREALEEIVAFDDGSELNWGHAQDAIETARAALADSGCGER